MSKTVFIHVGLPKTGTSALQLVLRANEEALARQGIVYPGLKQDPEYERFANHRVLLVALGGRRAARAARDDPQRCQAMVASTVESFRADATAKTLVWSHESLAGFAARWDFSFVERTLEGAALKLILYVRYLDDWLESQYRQLLWGQSLRPVETVSREGLLAVEALCKNWLRNINPLTVVAALGEHMPDAEVVLRSYDAVRSGERLVDDFLAVIGAERREEGKRGFVEHRTNVSPPTADIALLRNLWHGGAEPQLIRETAQALVRTTKAARASIKDISLRFVPEGIGREARALYAAAASRFPYLPVQPEAAPPDLDEGDLREPMLSRLALARSEMNDNTYQAALKALR